VILAPPAREGTTPQRERDSETECERRKRRRRRRRRRNSGSGFSKLPVSSRHQQSILFPPLLSFFSFLSTSGDARVPE